MADSSTGADTSLFRRHARDLVRRAPVTCLPDASASAAAAAMSAAGTGSVVVVDPAGAPVGIVTLRDLRTRLLAAGLAGEAPLRAIMSAPLVSVDADAFAFDAWLAMVRHGFHHVGVVDGGRLVGVLGGDDFASFLLTDPVALARDLDLAPSTEALLAAAPRVPDLVARLFRDGAAPADIAAVVAEVNDRLVRRVVTLAEACLAGEGLGAPPAAYSWLAAGSEGRREQALRTDQDSALVYDDPPPGAEAAASYFTRLADRVTPDLEALGFARCRGGFMAETPRWRQSRSAWVASLRGWFDAPTPQALLEASVYLDLRPVAGAAAPGDALRRLIVAEGPSHPRFHRHLARTALEHRAPLGLLGGLSVPRRGPHRGTLDLKAHGIFPVTQAMRVYAVALGLPHTNTLERLAGACEAGAFTTGEARDLAEAYAALLRLRLAHQLGQVAAGLPPDSRVSPAALGRLDRAVLTEAMRTVGWLARHVETRFQTAALG
jgi:CBS domain-containing protein